MSSTTASPDWRRIHAFGLPGGSIRGLLALAMFGAVWTHLALVPDRRLPEYLQNLMFIILGHYFAARNGRRLPRIVEDLRALVSLAAAAVLILMVFDLWEPAFPVQRFLIEDVLAAVVGFYFGSRS
ncbi:MAG: hypothetical protein WKG01_42585 [Kofleriaceae bacterium]